VKVQLYVTSKFETSKAFTGKGGFRRVKPESEFVAPPTGFFLVGAPALMNLPTSSTVIDAGHVERPFVGNKALPVAAGVS
jgi:hypothetical protein